MARGSYLGKISAIVSINTSSVRPSLDASSKDINAWAKSTQSRISGAANSAGRALEGIFTPLQRLQAAIKNANRNPLDLKIQNPGAYLQLAKATEQIAKPLGQVQAQFAGLANSVQAELLPVLQSAQKQTTSLFNAISSGAKVSDRDLENTAARVERLNQVIRRAAEANQIARGGRTGNELAFAAPRVQDELSRSAQLSQRAADAPVGVRSDPSFRQRIQELDQLRQRIVQYQASVDRRQALGLDTREARAGLDDTIRRSKDLRSSLERTIDLDVRAGEARAEIDRLRVAIRDIREGVTFTVTGRVQNFEQARQEVSRLQSQIGELSSGRSAFSGRLQQLSELVATGDITELEQVRRLIDDISESLSERQRLDIDAEAATRAAQELDRTLRSLRENADFVITARPQNLEQVQSELQRILGQFDQLSESRRGLLGGRVTAVIEAVGRQDLDAAIEALQLLRRDAGTAITVTVDTAAAEDRIRRINEAWDYAVRGVPSSIAQVDGEFQALAGRIGRLNITDRLNLDPLIRDFRDSVQAGESLFAQFQRLLTIRERLEAIESAAAPATGGLGAALGDPSRQIEQLRSGIVGVKGQLDSLPASIRTSFIPAINAAEAEFARLAALGPAAAAEEIENATNNMRTLTAAAQRAQAAFNFNASFGGANAQGLDLSLQSRSLQGYQAQLQTLQQVLGRVSSEARGPAYASFIRLQQAISTAFENGTLDAVATRAEIARLTADAVQATAAVANISAGSLSRDLRRAGDVGRGGVDKFSLALNQAAFAIDDFLSSTGGLEFKLRAISNNITQLGFVSGGTTGLFISLAAVIAGQLAVSIVRYVNDGRSAEDQTKALNESLSKQKSLVEGLAAAYEKVADAVRDAGLSERGRRDAGIRRQVEDIQRQQRQAREERILGLDLGVAAARGNVARAERELGASTTVGQRVRAELELNAARQRQREEERRALEQAGSPLGGIREAVIAGITSQIELETQGAVAGARAAAVASGGFGGEGAFAAARETERRNNERIAALQGIGGSPEEALAALDERIDQLVKSGASGDVILPLQQLRERILVYTKQLEGDRLASRISEGVLRIVDAMESANADISSAFDGVRGASAIESDLASFGETLAQFQKAAAEAAGRGDVGQVQAINEDINAINAHIAALRDAAAAVRVFGSELQRLSESVAQDLSYLEQRAEDARRADVAAGTDASRQQRDRAESDARDARRAQRQFEDQRASATERFEQDARANNDPRFRRVREIDAMLAVPMNEVGADGRTRGGTAQERDAARAERRALQESIDNSVNNDPAVIEARRQRDAMTARAQEAQSIDRGRKLSLTPGQRAGEELDQQIADIREYFNQAVENSSGLPEDVEKIRDKMNEAIQRTEEDAKRAIAPAVFALQDAVQNAILQGPSRAALNAADVTTMEGSRELNRLLRGDDPAKDVNLLELQKQTKLLEDIAKKEPLPVV